MLSCFRLTEIKTVFQNLFSKARKNIVRKIFPVGLTGMTTVPAGYEVRVTGKSVAAPIAIQAPDPRWHGSETVLLARVFEPAKLFSPEKKFIIEHGVTFSPLND